MVIKASVKAAVRLHHKRGEVCVHALGLAQVLRILAVSSRVHGASNFDHVSVERGRCCRFGDRQIDPERSFWEVKDSVRLQRFGLLLRVFEGFAHPLLDWQPLYTREAHQEGLQRVVPEQPARFALFAAALEHGDSARA